MKMLTFKLGVTTVRRMAMISNTVIIARGSMHVAPFGKR